MPITLNGDNGITNVNGSAAAPAITGTDTDSGMYFATNSVALSTAGTMALTVDSSQNVGIGTVSPSYKLDTTGTLRIQNAGIVILTSTGTTAQAYLGSYNSIVGSGSTSDTLLHNAVGGLAFQTNGVTSNKMYIDTSGNLQFNSGYGSAATAYGCRAWVNFNGTGTVAIRASGNVSSITDAGTGAYTVNFTTALVDNNYTAVVTGRRTDGGGPSTGDSNITSAVAGSGSLTYSSAVTTSAVKVVTGTANPAGSGVDADCFVAIFR